MRLAPFFAFIHKISVKKCDICHVFRAKPWLRAVYWHEKEKTRQTRQAEIEEPRHLAERQTRQCAKETRQTRQAEIEGSRCYTERDNLISRARQYCKFFNGIIYFSQGVFMNTLILVAICLGLLSSILRLILFFWDLYDRKKMLTRRERRRARRHFTTFESPKRT